MHFEVSVLQARDDSPQVVSQLVVPSPQHLLVTLDRIFFCRSLECFGRATGRRGEDDPLLLVRLIFLTDFGQHAF